MISEKLRPRGFRYLGTMLFLIALPACHGAGPWYRNQDNSSNVVYRPTYPPPGGRTFYVSSYGGADYSPSRPRRNMADCPVPPVAAPAPAADSIPPTVTVNQGSWDTE